MYKIVFVGSHLARYRGTLGPSEKIAELLKKKYNIILVSRFENQLIRLLDITFTTIFCDYDCIHIDVFSNRAFYYANIASLIAKLKKKPIVMTLHGGMLAEKYERDSQHIKKVLKRADIIQSPSLFLKEFFLQHGFEVNYMPNFIDLSHFPYDRNSIKPYSLLWVRAFSSEYRPELAVKVLYELLKKYPDVTLTMVGPDKGMKDDTKRVVKELGLEKKVKFEGSIPNEKLHSYYQSHAVYLNTTRYESFGVAVLEAAACGIPVVSTRVGEIPYVWDEGKEMLMCDANASEMAMKVGMLFDSEELTEKISKNAHKKAESFDWETIKSKWVNLLTNMGAEE